MALVKVSVLGGCDDDACWRCVREGCACWLMIKFQSSAAA